MKRNLLESFLYYSDLCAGRIRAQLMRVRGAKIGEKVYLGKGVRVMRAASIEIGDRVTVEDNVAFKCVEDGAILRLGAFTFVGRGTQFDVGSRVEVGEHALFAPRCFITDHTHRTKLGLRIDEQGCDYAPVRIGMDAWLGAGVVVLHGITIGDGAVIGANGVVTKDIAPNCIAVGSPARVIGSRDEVGESRLAELMEVSNDR